MSFSSWPGYGPQYYQWGSVDTLNPSSGHAMVRPLGILEAKFDQAAHAYESSPGMADTFIKLKVRVPGEFDSDFFARVPCAWARLRAVHPALASTIETCSSLAQELPWRSDRVMRHETAQNANIAYLRALDCVTVEDGGLDAGQRQKRSDEMLQVILNGPRIILDQSECLARIVIIRDRRIGAPAFEHELFLVISHVISDGLSLVSLVRELFTLLSNASLPTPVETPMFLRLNDLVSSLHEREALVSKNKLPPTAILDQWQIATISEQAMSLPLEAFYPTVPLKNPYESTARRRWYWAITRVILLRHQRAYPRARTLPRSQPVPNHPISSQWPTLKLDRVTSQGVMRICKAEGLSPSMLLYAVLALVASNMTTPTDCVVLGFPCSARPYLEPASPQLLSDMAIRLTFGSVYLPHMPQDEVAGPRLRKRLLQQARSAKRQFQRRLNPDPMARSFFFADTYFRTLDRLLTSLDNNPIPLEEPKTLMNASMIGDLDRLLPTSFPLAHSPSDDTANLERDAGARASDSKLELSDLLIGTRLHRGEDLLIEAYTWDGMITTRNLQNRSFASEADSSRSSYYTPMLTGGEIQKHASQESLWMIINDQAYDLTRFAPNHPGGMKILLKYAGKDATAEYEPIHPKGTLESALTSEECLGPVDMSTVDQTEVEEAAAPQINPGAPQSAQACLNLHDIERAAESRLKPKGFAYYASAADDERTKNWNHDSFSKVRFRPRVLRDVRRADLSTKIFGFPSSMPVFIAPAAMGRLAHPDGELCLARVAHAEGIPYMVSANSSISFDELADLNRNSANPQMLIYQCYVNKDRSKTDAQLLKVKAAGFKAICITVDAPVAGKRERDERSKMDAESASDPSMRDAVRPASTTPDKPQGIAQSLGSYVDAALNWSDLAHFRQLTGLPLILKGIQTAEDAALAVQHGVEGIYLSNHGGRQLEGAPSALETLLEIRRHEPQVFDQAEVYIDGGIRRGTDVLKALCLGATAVGVGRPFMYSLTFGDTGVTRVTEILRQELAQNLRLLGATALTELRSSMVNAKQLERDVIDAGDYQGPETTTTTSTWTDRAQGVVRQVKARL